MRGYVKRVTQKASKLSKEQVLSILEDVLEENESLYSIFESISTGILIVDNDFILQQANSIVESRLPFNVHTDDPKANMLPVWDIIDDDDICIYLKNCFSKSITNSSEDFSIMTPGGNVRFITLAITPLIHKGELKGRIILVRDITENKNQEVRLHRMENMANLTNLAAGMAHEIKNPLGAISIHIQLVQKALLKARENENILPDKKFVENHIDVVNEEVEHLNKLIMDFLLAVRPVNATLELKNPGKLIQNIVDFFTPEFNNEKIKVNFDVKDNGAKIMLDEKLLREIVLNLSQNALAAIKTKKSNIDTSIDEQYDAIFAIKCFKTENRYIIQVQDNGCGMSKENVSKIFEPYFTTKANGTGLGMTMVYKIVKEFSGEINVDSIENVGTTFTMFFPLPQKNKKLLTNEGI